MHISTGTSSSHMLLLNTHTMDKDTDLVGLFLEVSWKPPQPLLTYNHVCCSPQVTQSRTLSATLTYGHCGKLLHGCQDWRQYVRSSPPAASPSPPCIPSAGTISIQGTVWLLSSSPPTAGLGSAGFVLGDPQWHNKKVRVCLEKLAWSFSPYDSFSLIQLISLWK